MSIASPTEHIVKAFDTQLDDLRHAIVKMGGMAETQVADAVEALIKRDADAAVRLIQIDREVDRLEHLIDKTAVRLIALRQPMAVDLREVVSALKISGALERIGDYACNIAQRTRSLSQLPAMPPAHVVPRMARLVQAEIKGALDAYVQHDAEKALEVWRSDEEVDEMYTSLFRELLTYMMEDPRNITPCTHLLFVARNIERIGDHATNIAEYVYYLVTGIPMTLTRPMADGSSFAGVELPKAIDDMELKDGERS